LLRPVGLPIVRTRQGKNSQRRPRQMESGRPRDDTRSSEISAHKLSDTEATIRQGDSGVCRGGVGAKQGEETVDRCAFTRRIQGRDHAYAGVSTGRRLARWSHSRGEKCALENGGEGRRHL